MEVLQGLALVAATQADTSMPRNSRPWRLLRTVINHAFLVRALGLEGARNLYGSLESLLNWDYHYWLQRGSLEVEVGELSLAENFLNQAHSLATDDPLVETERAYLFFRQALENPGGLQAQRLVAEGTTTLNDLIARRGRADSYPYHVLGSQGLAWARRGIPSRRDRERYIQGLIRRIEEGTENHPKEANLQELLQDLRRELLTMALPPGGSSTPS